MEEASARPATSPPAMASAGARWLERFLLPILDDLLADVKHEAVRRCLQLQPDNEEEALHLRGKGWICDLLVEEGTDLSPWEIRIKPPSPEPSTSD